MFYRSYELKQAFCRHTQKLTGTGAKLVEDDVIFLQKNARSHCQCAANKLILLPILAQHFSCRKRCRKLNEKIIAILFFSDGPGSHCYCSMSLRTTDTLQHNMPMGWKEGFLQAQIFVKFIALCRSTIIFRYIPFSAIPSMLHILITRIILPVGKLTLVCLYVWCCWVEFSSYIMLVFPEKYGRSNIDAIADVLNAKGIFLSFWF